MNPTIGIDIGGTKIAGGLVDSDGTILRRGRRETPAQDVDAITSAVADLIAELGEGEQITHAGVACAGYIDKAGSTVLFAPNLAWRDEPLKERLQDMVDLDITIENDANAAAYGEFVHGAGHDVDDMVMITIGTGVGGGVIFDGELFRGSYGIGAEIGHMRVVPNGLRCGCGNRGCLESYASGSALIREARALVTGGSPYAATLSQRCGGKPKRLEGKDVTIAAQEGDPASIELLADLGRWIGEGAASLAAILDPARFVIGGGVAEAGDLLLAPIKDAFGRQLTGRGHRPTATFEIATLANDAGLVGAAALVRQREA
ncbi:ROK family glucokinase [Yimella sp. cx-51]|uniref:ROK family glucokinase n=1 Tax=Yimella sp. cx-51 TaxID=2770551 RepID=UPI00165D7915|nr:ROK family glucokinase [Yimella sp. cx-51]MBC9957608.1 ROK family glucokinase [Yimella sp. cx-51]MBD2758650.1 ROK family glucokinase [Yimella sp. cx-573]QTH37032.1 ROK family glucokinase [Yimella sp. cx-51]